MIRILLAATALIPLSLASGCASGEAGGETVTKQPRKAVYQCGDVALTVENAGHSLTLTLPDGTVSTLPAAPSGQTARYGDQSQALVLDGREALWMAAGRAPTDCKR